LETQLAAIMNNRFFNGQSGRFDQIPLENNSTQCHAVIIICTILIKTASICPTATLNSALLVSPASLFPRRCVSSLSPDSLLLFLQPPSPLSPQTWPRQSRRSSSSRSCGSAAFSSTSCPTRWATWNGRKSSGRRWAKWWSTSPTTGTSSRSPSTRRWCTWSVKPEGLGFVVKAEVEGETRAGNGGRAGPAAPSAADVVMWRSALGGRAGFLQVSIHSPHL